MLKCLPIPRVLKAWLFAACAVPCAFAQQAFTWDQIKTKFAATNPTLKAAQLNIDESRAAEITAYLRPNPDFSLSVGRVSNRPECRVCTVP